ncbi:N4-gp56 family major capsid protein [Neobacillus mesonae]|uniref:N4-gp56 family major capsid protein n=1 Tax=Neobacillus mesonae TaxID=1193713 RepID=UPI00257299A6|nr:N4-gp56 family major capsid protein [Neobacillus mesonae]
MAQTKLANLVNPQVMADMISAGVKSKIKFAPLARMDETLVGQAGDTVTVPRYEYIGDAEDLTEGVAMGTTVLTASTQSVTVKQAGKAVEITDKAALAGYGDPVGEAESQLETSIAQKVDRDCVAALNGATLVHDASVSPIAYDSIVEAIDKFEEEDDEQKILFIHPLQKSVIRQNAQFLEHVGDAFMTGVIGEIAGCQVVASNKVKKDDVAGTYSNLIVKPGALAIYLKRDVLVETDRDILAKTTVISADEHYAAALEDESKVVKLVVKQF